MSLEARAMRFGKFVWGRNPETLQVEYQRNVKRLTLPQVGKPYRTSVARGAQ